MCLGHHPEDGRSTTRASKLSPTAIGPGPIAPTTPRRGKDASEMGHGHHHHHDHHLRRECGGRAGNRSPPRARRSASPRSTWWRKSSGGLLSNSLAPARRRGPHVLRFGRARSLARRRDAGPAPGDPPTHLRFSPSGNSSRARKRRSAPRARPCSSRREAWERMAEPARGAGRPHARGRDRRTCR